MGLGYSAPNKGFGDFGVWPIGQWVEFRVNSALFVSWGLQYLELQVSQSSLRNLDTCKVPSTQAHIARFVGLQ